MLNFVMKKSVDKDVVKKLKQLEKERNQLASIIESSDDAIFSKSIDGTVLNWNKSAEKLYGFRKEEIIGKLLTSIIPDNYIPEWKELMKKIKRGIAVSQFDTIGMRKDGTTFNASVSISPIKDRNHIVGATVICRDISKKIKAEEELKNMFTDLKDVKYALDQSSIVAITDNSGVIQYVNDKFIEISKYSREELIGKTHRVVNSKYHSHEFIKNLWETILSGKVWHGELRNQAKDGSFYWVDTTITPLLDNNGKPKQFVAIRNDITGKKQLEQKKDEFINVASHELKTPLTSAKAFVQILNKYFSRKGDAQALSYLNKMNKQINRLTLLVQEFLDTTKIQAGKMVMKMTLFDIVKLIRDVTDDFREISSGRTFIYRGVRKLVITADYDRIGQVITNILSNAVKYSDDKKGIMINLINKHPEICVSIQDYGFGIASENQEKIFERFYQVDKRVRKNDPSLGLGLYISREIITRHGGKIWVESQEEKGSTFYFTLPYH